MKNFLINFKHIFTFGGGLATLAAIIKDVLTPLSSFGLWIFICSLLLGVLVFTVGYFFPKLFENNTGVIKELWYIPLGLSLILTSGLIAFIHDINQQPGNENGLISKHLGIVKQLQEQSGILINMDSTLSQSLAVHQESLSIQKSINSNVASINNENKELSATLAFDLDALHDALLRGDIAKLTKFHQRGFQLSDVKISRNLAEAPLIIEGLRANKKNYDQVIAFLLKLGVIELDEQFDIKPEYSNAYTYIWQDLMYKGTEIDELANKGIEFTDFQKAYLHDFAYDIPDDFKATYESKDLNAISMSLIGVPLGAKVSLFTEASFHHNTKVLSFLKEQQVSGGDKDVIMMKHQIKIHLAHYLASI